uniref:Alphavirus-like MT domain-containing protein n=1 Tax=Clastoptera arizonana TaxID=38151 RepID=A0A1B6DRE7_9HEMI
MDAQAIIDTATAANAAALGNGAATEYYRAAVGNGYKVTLTLKPSEQCIVKRDSPFTVIFTCTDTVTHDHPVIAAYRQLARSVMERVFQISNTTERTLCIGATMREISKYNNNPNIHYYVYGGESKDSDRIIRPALRAIAETLRRKAAKTDRRVFMKHPKQHVGAHPERPIAKRYAHMKTIFDDYITANKLPEVIHLQPVKANTLVFEDSIYNFTAETLVELFEETGAILGYGYGLFPMELLFPELPANKLYNFTRDGPYSLVTFKAGVSNGYRHLTRAWRTILENPVIVHHGKYLVVEIVSRIGCMCVFKIMVATQPEHIVRTIGLTQHESFVKLLNIQEIFCPRMRSLRTPLVYMSIREDEFYDTVNYMLSLDVKSQSFTNCMAYVRRRMGGMSLVTKELLAPWDLPKNLVLPFSLAVTCYVSMLSGDLLQYADPNNITYAGLWDTIKQGVKDWFRLGFTERFSLIKWLINDHLLQDELLLSPNNEQIQMGVVRARATMMGSVINDEVLPGRYYIDADLDLNFPNEEDIPSCDVCCMVQGKLGPQIVSCDGQITYCDFGLTDSEIQKLRGDLLNTDGDPPGLAAVKKKALEGLPSKAFNRKVRIHYVKAGPGCGKSHMIRLLADENDLVCAPFSKLIGDYTNLKSKTGEYYNLTFKTQHRAISTRGHARIFVDEFTSYSYDMLAVTVYNNAADEVFLVGDDRQTRIQEPDEGIYIGSKINLNLIATHELLMNFRNPPDTVALLNKLFGYQMRAFKAPTPDRSITVHETTEVNDLPENALRMCFSKATSAAITEDPSNTVRANQGGTYSCAKLFVANTDGSTANTECLQVVGLSRHTEHLYVVVDTSDPAMQFLSKLPDDDWWDPENPDGFKSELNFAPINMQLPETSDAVISRILGGVDSDNAQSSDDEIIQERAFKLAQNMYVDHLMVTRKNAALDTDSSDDDNVKETTTRPYKRKVHDHVLCTTEDIGVTTNHADTVEEQGVDTDLDVTRILENLDSGVDSPDGSEGVKELSKSTTPESDSGRNSTGVSDIDAPDVSDVDRREEIATVFYGTITGCICGKLIDVSLTDNFRVHPTSTSLKIDQLLGILAGHTVDFEALCILGGAPRPRASVIPMYTENVEETYRKVWSVDPRFIGNGNYKGAAYIKAEFQTITDIRNTSTFFSDMYCTGSWPSNNLLADVVDWYIANVGADNTDKLKNFVLIHKLTWSTTNTVELAKVCARVRHFEILRVAASGAGSEYFVLLRDLTGRSLTTCCALAREINDMYLHVQDCTNCLNGRLRTIADQFTELENTKHVRTNCVLSGNNDTYTLARHIYNKKIRHGKIRDGRKFEDIYPKIHPRNLKELPDHYTKEHPVTYAARAVEVEPTIPTETDATTVYSDTDSVSSDYEKVLSTQVIDKKKRKTKLERKETTVATVGVLQLRPKIALTGSAQVIGRQGTIFASALDKPMIPTRMDVPDTVVTPVETVGRNYMAAYPDFMEHVQTWIHDTRLGLREYERMPLVQHVPQRMLHPPRDSHLGASELLGAAAGFPDITSWNWLTSQKVYGKFRTGKIDFDNVLAPVNGRRHPVNLVESYYSAGPGYGLHFSSKKPCQTLAVMETRYLGKKKSFPFGYREMQLADKIADIFFDRNVKPMSEWVDCFSEADIDLAFDEYYRDAQSKGYAARYAGTNGLDCAESRTVRFSLKTVFKPKTKFDVNKVGQGISAWSVQALSMFCGVFRVLTKQALKNLRENIITDAYWDEPTFMRVVNQQFAKVPTVAKHAIVDGIQFDACQNQFTQRLERRFWSNMGVSEEAIDLYYSFRAKFLMLSSVCSGRSGYEKTSGEPGTLINNGIVQLLNADYVVEGDGPYAIVFKGDDFCKHQCNLRVNEERLAEINSACDLGLRVDITDDAEFCGLTVVGDCVFPAILRKLNKVLSHRFRDYEHFCQYQTALRDWIHLVEEFGADKVVGCNAFMQKTTFEHIQSALDAIKAFSHINKAQFTEQFAARREAATIPVLDRVENKIVMTEV